MPSSLTYTCTKCGGHHALKILGNGGYVQSPCDLIPTVPLSAVVVAKSEPKGPKMKAGAILNLAVLKMLLDAGWKRDVDFVKEYVFSDERDWRFDFAFPAQRVAVESDGRVHDVVHEQRLKDREKLNEAAALGWRVVRATRKTVEEGVALDTVRRAVAWRSR